MATRKVYDPAVGGGRELTDDMLRALEQLELDEDTGELSIPPLTGTFVPGFVADAATYGDGVTDATAHLQGLLDAAAAAGGGTVFLPKGQFFASTLTIDSKVTLQGVGPWASEIKQIASTTGSLLSLETGSTINVVVRDLLLHGNNTNQTNANDLINFDNTAGGSSTLARHRILNVHLRSPKGRGLYLGPYTRSTIVDGVNIYGASAVGMHLAGADTQVSNVDVGQSGSHGVQVAGHSYQIANVKSWYSGQSGSNGYGFLIEGSGNTLTGCFSQENRQHGFIVFKSGTVLTGNSLLGCTSDADGTVASQAGFNLFNNTGTIVRGAVLKTSGLLGTPVNGVQLDSSCTECDVVLTVSGNSGADINTEANAADNRVILNGVSYPQAPARVSYNPGTSAQASTTSSTFANADATNLVVTGIVPRSGKIRIILEGVANCGSSATYTLWNIRDGSGDVAGTARVATNGTSRVRVRTSHDISGLTPGATFTYYWGHASSDNTNTANINRGAGTPNYGPAIMEVEHLPN